ncbi:hypothetical protein TRVL_06802 [Trypanosoma vivax]|nr:hypothetical protein TRVL_06802 [Trypanosoma vivax]
MPLSACTCAYEFERGQGRRASETFMLPVLLFHASLPLFSAKEQFPFADWQGFPSAAHLHRRSLLRLPRTSPPALSLQTFPHHFLVPCSPSLVACKFFHAAPISASR